jgi:hypothetical protein
MRDPFFRWFSVCQDVVVDEDCDSESGKIHN